MSVFDFTDYKSFLKEYLKRNNRRGTLTELAKSAGCTHSYLSQVLSGKPELTPDQGLLATDFLQLSSIESKYFLFLVLKARAATQKLKRYYEDQLKILRTESVQLKTVIADTAGAEISTADRDFYYASWVPSMIHILTACSDYQTSQAIATRTHLSLKEVNSYLDWLLQRGLIKKVENKYIYLGNNIHLPTQSLHNRLNHLNWRQKSQEKYNDKAAINYTALFAVSEKDLDTFRAKLLDFIEQQRESVSRSGSEEVFVFCCDLFQP